MTKVNLPFRARNLHLISCSGLVTRNLRHSLHLGPIFWRHIIVSNKSGLLKKGTEPPTSTAGSLMGDERSETLLEEPAAAFFSVVLSVIFIAFKMLFNTSESKKAEMITKENMQKKLIFTISGKPQCFIIAKKRRLKLQNLASVIVIMRLLWLFATTVTVKDKLSPLEGCSHGVPK